MKRILFFILVIVVAATGIFLYYRFSFEYGKGVKAGELNFFVNKGYIFKTYEGRLIQTGYRTQVPGSIQSNEFDFSVVDEKVADILSRNSGATLELHYKEYLGTLPWRGMSRYVVDSVVAIRDANGKPKGLN